MNKAIHNVTFFIGTFWCSLTHLLRGYWHWEEAITTDGRKFRTFASYYRCRKCSRKWFRTVT